jgi:hypothetical protein
MDEPVLVFVYSILAHETLSHRRAAFEAQAREEIGEIAQDWPKRGRPATFHHVLAPGEGSLHDRLSDGRLIYYIAGHDRQDYWDCRVQLGHFHEVGKVPNTHKVVALRGKPIMMPEVVDAPGNDTFLTGGVIPPPKKAQ